MAAETLALSNGVVANGDLTSNANPNPSAPKKSRETERRRRRRKQKKNAKASKASTAASSDADDDDAKENNDPLQVFFWSILQSEWYLGVELSGAWSFGLWFMYCFEYIGI